MRKGELRKIYLQKRNELASEKYQQLFRQIHALFFSVVNLNSVNIIHIFLSIQENKEPNTWPIIDDLKKNYPDLKIAIPKVHKDSNEMDNFFYEGLHQLKKNKWGILEPEHGVSVAPQQIDMVVIPLLAFDEKGHRVGYGKGFYDRFLNECRDDVQRIGLSLFDPVENIDDTTALDIPLTHCITPSKVYTF